MTRDAAIGTSRGIEVQNDTATETYVVAPDIAAVRQAFWDWPHWCGRGTPERAWEHAVSGDTAARLRTSEKVTDWECTARIIARAAAYGWWPQETTSGRLHRRAHRPLGCRWAPLHQDRAQPRCAAGSLERRAGGD